MGSYCVCVCALYLCWCLEAGSKHYSDTTQTEFDIFECMLDHYCEWAKTCITETNARQRQGRVGRVSLFVNVVTERIKLMHYLCTSARVLCCFVTCTANNEIIHSTKRTLLCSSHMLLDEGYKCLKGYSSHGFKYNITKYDPPVSGLVESYEDTNNNRVKWMILK